jgi:hypothetical protein
MPDLDVEALRAEVQRFMGATIGWRSRANMIGDGKLAEFARWASVIAGSLHAVLELHKPRIAVEGTLEGKPICDECSDGTDEFLARDYPCPTVRAIAKELGVEVERD